MPFSPRLRQVESEPTSDPDAPPARSDAPPTPVRLRGRVIGFVAAGVFRRTLRPEHYLRKPHAIALDEDVLVELGQLGVDLLVFTDAESGVMYSATLDRFWSASFGIDRGGASAGYGVARLPFGRGPPGAATGLRGRATFVCRFG